MDATGHLERTKKDLTIRRQFRLNHHCVSVSRSVKSEASPSGAGIAARARPKKEGGDVMSTPVTVPMVGKIVSVSVRVGDRVEENDQVAVLEAMKMEMPVVAPVRGEVKQVCVAAGQEVEAETPIVLIG